MFFACELGVLAGWGYISFMAVHMIKLIVGAESLEQYAQWQESQVMDYHGQPAVPCMTRFMAKRADEILRSGGSLYRVHKSRIICRSKILGFEMVDVEGQGKKCMIMQSPEIMSVVNAPHRPFQGWRYFEQGAAPDDRGVYIIGQDDEQPPEEMSDELREAGLL